MLTATQIRNIFQTEGISVYETYFSFDKDVDIALKTDNIRDLLKLVQENNIKSVFYSYEYIDPDDYFITDTDVPDFDTYTAGRELVYNAFMKKFKAEQTRFNKSVSALMSNDPTMLCVFCGLNGVQVGILWENPWHINLPDKSEIVAEFDDLLDDMYTKACENAYSKEEEKRNDIFEKIIKYLDSTDEWHVYTNQRLRRNYCYGLVTKYEKEFGLRVEPFRIVDELEIRWNQYKLNKQI